ncbi:Lrp/AsnC family transcriptional regulator [Nocardia sp. A7]|uniref:Lrp/AsnC family transcriptional regulator n=1 Tax=Nocardia sp. A7 TaxID=2789274 RepID=UPI00397DD463
MESVDLDELDRRLIHALQLDGRAPFRRMAEVLGVSERTVARRYQRLRSHLVLRVVGRVNSARVGLVDAVVLIRCAPGADEQLAAALARRPDTSWVALLAGGAELTCMFATPAGTDLAAGLARLPGVRDLTVSTILRFIAGTEGWAVRTNALTADEMLTLATSNAEPAVPIPNWTEQDARLAAELGADGRAELHRLAATTGWSEPTVRRRLATWRAAGVLEFEVEIDPALFGYREEALVWLAVAPAGLAEVVGVLREHPGVAFAATTTGSWSVFAIVELQVVGDLHDFVTIDLAALPAVTRIETNLIRRRTKRAGPLTVSAAVSGRWR